MKHICLILFLLLCNLSSAQDLRLFDNYWYLTNVIKNGISNVPPRTDMGVVFDSPTSMVARACYFLYGEVTFENNTTGFSGTHFSPCLCWCTDPIADAYEGVYFSFFTPDHNYQAVENFTYTITEQDDEKTLIINSTLNEQAIYSNIALSNRDFAKLDLNFYPNPATDFIMITLNNRNTGNLKMELYDSLGKLCKSENLKATENKIETKDLPGGVYFIRVNDGNETVSKKIIKI